MNQRVGSVIFGIAVGLIVAALSYQWIMDPDRREQRSEQERVVAVSRAMLIEKLAKGDIELVDPLAPQRKVGKVYIYPLANGWEISGYYRRNDDDRWHPYLLTLSTSLSLLSMKVKDSDAGLAQLAAMDPTLEVLQ